MTARTNPHLPYHIATKNFFRKPLSCWYFHGLHGATDWDRTSNLRLRRPTLYPIELQSQL